jgi:hypothetical protein
LNSPITKVVGLFAFEQRNKSSNHLAVTPLSFLFPLEYSTQPVFLHLYNFAPKF